MSFSRVVLRWTWLSTIIGITVLPARLTRRAPGGAATWGPMAKILRLSTTMFTLSSTVPSPTMIRAPSNAVACANAGLALRAAADAMSAMTKRWRIQTSRSKFGHLFSPVAGELEVDIDRNAPKDVFQLRSRKVSRKAGAESRGLMSNDGG